MGFDLMAYSDVNDKYFDGTDMGCSAWLHAFYSDPNIPVYIDSLNMSQEKGHRGVTTLKNIQAACEKISLEDFKSMRINVRTLEDREVFDWSDKEYHYKKLQIFLDTLIKNTTSEDTRIIIRYG